MGSQNDRSTSLDRLVPDQKADGRAEGAGMRGNSTLSFTRGLAGDQRTSGWCASTVGEPRDSFHNTRPPYAGRAPYTPPAVGVLVIR